MRLLWLLAITGCILADPRIDRLMAVYDKPESPGCQVGVIREGGFIYKRAFGAANLEYRIPLTTHSITYIASVSKQFTAMSILLLEKDGKLSLDDSIRKYIPELPSWGDPVTIRQLLHHTSGVRDYFAIAELAGQSGHSFSNEDVLDLLARQKGLNNAPGAQQIYSNSGYVLLSIVVRRASGKTLREFAGERIFVPLGMNDTHFHDNHAELIPNRAAGYIPRGGKAFAIANNNLDVVGDGGVYTNLEDLLSWDRNFYSGKVGGAGLIRRMQIPGANTKDYGMGLATETYRGLRAVSHGGWLGGYRAEVLRFPDEEFTVICLCNHGGADAPDLARKIAGFYLADKLKPEAPTPVVKEEKRNGSAGTLADFVGDFASTEVPAEWCMVVEKGKLTLKRGLAWSIPLDEFGADEFHVGPWTLHFERNAQRVVTGFRLDSGRLKGIQFQKK